MRPLVDMVRGKKVDEALNLLRFTPTPKAKVVAKLVRSAAANAENNFQMDPADLKIIRIFVDDARSLRRFRPRSRGRVSPIRKHSSHITVVVAEQEG
jgi:large subunit ribosomal protein L22